MDPNQLLPLILTQTIKPLELLYLLTFCEIDRPLRVPFHLEQITDGDIFLSFRFSREDLPRLLLELKIPDVVRLDNGSVFCGMEALCVLLRRLAYPNRLVDIKHIFRRQKGELSKVFNWMLNHVNEKFGHLLSTLNLCWLRVEDMVNFARAIQAKGSPLPNVWGFIDGTFRPCCRPGRDQRALYSGHYRLHGIKFQAIMAPNGIIVNLDGPWVGRRHDAGMLQESGLLDMLREKMHDLGQTFLLYGDPAYPISEVIEGPFRQGAAPLTQVETNFNERMSGVRISVEWGFGEVVQQFAFLDFSKNLKIGLQSVGKYYAVGTILTNCRVCLGYGGKTADFFGVVPPTLETYLRDVLE